MVRGSLFWYDIRMDGWYEEGWSEFQPDGKLPNQCFSMKLGRFKAKFATEQDVKKHLADTGATESMSYYLCPSCANYHKYTVKGKKKRKGNKNG